MIGAMGWRPAILTLGCVAGVIIVLTGLLVMKDWPDAGELAAGGELPPAREGQIAEATGLDEPLLSTMAIIGRSNFWLFLIAIGLLTATDQALIALTVPFYLSKGISLETAALLMALQLAASVAGKLVVGLLAERFDILRIFVFVITMHIVLLVVYIAWPGNWVIAAVILLTGLSLGGSLPVMKILTVNIFGARNYGQASSAVLMGVQLLSAAFLHYSGAAFDASGNYDTAFMGFMAATVIALGAACFIRLPRT
jgi:cyanate permease